MITRIGLTHPPGKELESLFERFHWFYAFCREHIFQDDTEQISKALWPGGVPPAGSRFVELGCGPGFYSCRMAERFSHLEVIGIDLIEQQLHHARLRAAAYNLDNCRFERDDVRALALAANTIDAIVVSRLLIVLKERDKVLAEIHRLLKPGGRCFIAEPRSAFRAAIPLNAMWTLANIWALFGNRKTLYLEPPKVAVMNTDEFDAVVNSQPWKQVVRWNNAWYQYAVCEKDTGQAETQT